MEKNKTKYDNSQISDIDSPHFLILHNDEVNTFDYVIETLIEVCDHKPEQAEQCAYIVHFKGRADVKKGGFTQLIQLKDALVKKGLTATVE